MKQYYGLQERGAKLVVRAQMWWLFFFIFIVSFNYSLASMWPY